jgi:hypothetical protein
MGRPANRWTADGPLKAASRLPRLQQITEPPVAKGKGKKKKKKEKYLLVSPEIEGRRRKEVTLKQDNDPMPQISRKRVVPSLGLYRRLPTARQLIGGPWSKPRGGATSVMGALSPPTP